MTFAGFAFLALVALAYTELSPKSRERFMSVMVVFLIIGLLLIFRSFGSVMGGLLIGVLEAMFNLLMIVPRILGYAFFG